MDRRECGRRCCGEHVISECVNSALATVASHAHFLVRTWLKAQGAALMLSTFASFRKTSSPFSPCRHLHSLIQTQHIFHNTRHFATSFADHMEAPPQHSGPFGHPAFQSPLIGHEPNPTLAVISAEDTSAKASFCSTFYSVQEVPTVTVLTSEVHDPRIGRLASPLLEQKRGAYHSQRENSTAHSPHRSTGRPVARQSHKRKTSRDRISFTGRTARQRKNSS